MSNWTTPKTWAVDELVTAPVMNTHLRDNLGYLFARPATQLVQTSGSNHAVLSTAYVPVDEAQLRLTLTTHSGRVLIGLIATLTGNATLFAGFRVNIDNGARYEAWGESLQVLVTPIIAPLPPLLVVGLTPGAHTFVLESKVASHVLSIHRTPERPLRFWVMEV